MVYEFSFDGKSLWALFGGSAVLGFLLFLAGILLGANWTPSDEAARPAPPAAAQPAPAAPDAAAPAGVAYAPPRAYSTLPPPREPVVYDWPEGRDYAAQGYGAQGQAAQGYAARAPEPADYGAPQRHAGATAPAAAPVARDVAAAAPPVNLAREAARLSAAGIDADPRLVSEAGADAPGAAPGSASFSVQVGAYVEEAEARRVVDELEHKGYTPSVFSGRDAEGRPWHAVRIGAYANQREAARAADNFTRQERQKAVVRPFNSM